jgi:hypothetical protein
MMNANFSRPLGQIFTWPQKGLQRAPIETSTPPFCSILCAGSESSIGTSWGSAKLRVFCQNVLMGAPCEPKGTPFGAPLGDPLGGPLGAPLGAPRGPPRGLQGGPQGGPGPPRAPKGPPKGAPKGATKGVPKRARKGAPHVHVFAESLNFAEPQEVPMPDSESTHTMRQNGGVDVSIGAR